MRRAARERRAAIYSGIGAADRPRQIQYTGAPHTTITSPGQAVCVLYNSSAIRMTHAAQIYSAGITEKAGNREHVEDQHGEDHVVEQIAV